MVIEAEVRAGDSTAFTWQVSDRRVTVPAGETRTVEVTGDEYGSLHGEVSAYRDRHDAEEAYVRRADGEPEPWEPDPAPPFAALPEADVEPLSASSSARDAVACPYCDAEPGEACVTSSGNQREEPHAYRLEAYQDEEDSE